MPGFVVTNMTKGLKRSIISPLPDEFVRQALETIGMEPRTCGYWSHSLKVSNQKLLLLYHYFHNYASF